MNRHKHANGENGSEVEWERIMVQITFAFVIILGYLVSVGLDEANQLAAETKSQKDRNEALEALLVNLRGTDLGESEAGRIEAERKSQKEELLRIWAEYRVSRGLYTLLRQFDKAELIPLSDDLQCLPTADSFDDLNAEIKRVFLVEDQNVSLEEIIQLMTTVLERAHYDLAAVRLVFDPDQLSSEVGELIFDDKVPTRENLAELKGQIIYDLAYERRQLAALQEALVGKIANGRRDRIADLPLDEEVDMELGQAATGKFMFDRVLADLKEGMMLLPETVDRISEGTYSE